MNQKQKIILKKLQSEFPLHPRPYSVLAEGLGFTEKDLLREISGWKKTGIIRRIGAVASAGELGYKSVLLAAKVAPDKVERFAARVSKDDRVTHNYLRDAEYNVWFTFSYQSRPQLNDFLKGLRKSRLCGEIMILPAEKVYKIKAEFSF